MVRALLLAAVLVLGACERPAPEPEPTPTPEAVGPRADVPDPCHLLAEPDVEGVVGQDIEHRDVVAGETMQLCTYELADGIGTVDIALVDLQALADRDDLVAPDAYIEQLREGAGQGEVEQLSGVGSGDAISIAYQYGSQAWGWEGMLVVGAYTTNVLEPTPLAVRLLEAALDAL